MASTDFISDLIARYPRLSVCEDSLRTAVEIIMKVQRAGGTLFVAGNGGSAADAEHIAAEMLKGFLLPRPLTIAEKSRLSALGDDGKNSAEKLQRGMRCVALTSHFALLSAFANDIDGSLAFAQQLFVLAKSDDAVLGISTGGNSESIRQVLITARAEKLPTILLTGGKRGKCADWADVIIAAPETETFKIQELHLPIYHALCAECEMRMFGE